MCNIESPSNPLEDIHKLTATLNNVIVQGYTHVLILGDFNLKEIDWKTQTTDKNENHPSTIFLETIRDLFLHQHVKEPTRMRGEDIPTTLDLILTNEENMVEQLQYLPGLGISDHLVLVFTFLCYTEETVSEGHHLNYNRGNYEKMKEDIETNNCETTNGNVETT